MGRQVYMSLFVFPGDVSSRLKEKCSTCEDKIKTHESSKEYLSRSLKDSENSLRELIAQKKSTA